MRWVLSNHNQYSIQPSTGDMPQNILYFRVQYTVLADGNLSTGYSYDPISGFYPLSGITDFVSKILAGGPNPDDQLAPIPSDTLIPIIQYPCYIVFSVDLLGRARFSASQAAATTDDNVPADYFSLRTVPDSTAPNSYCHIAYLRALSPSSTGYFGTPYDGQDSFNLYFDVAQLDGSTKPGVIDPAVKNTGHDGGNILLSPIRERMKRVGADQPSKPGQCAAPSVENHHGQGGALSS